jgi:hypothetical protein
MDKLKIGIIIRHLFQRPSPPPPNVQRFVYTRKSDTASLGWPSRTFLAHYHPADFRCETRQ